MNEEAFDQLQPVFMVNILDNAGLKVKHLNTIKTVSEKPWAYIFLNGKLSKVRNETGISIYPCWELGWSTELFDEALIYGEKKTIFAFFPSNPRNILARANNSWGQGTRNFSLSTQWKERNTPPTIKSRTYLAELLMTCAQGLWEAVASVLVIPTLSTIRGYLLVIISRASACSV